MDAYHLVTYKHVSFEEIVLILPLHPEINISLCPSGFLYISYLVRNVDFCYQRSAEVLRCFKLILREGEIEFLAKALPRHGASCIHRQQTEYHYSRKLEYNS